MNQFFEQCGLNLGKIHISESSRVYPFNPNLTANWVYFTLVGYQQLKKVLLNENHELPKKIACVAVGSGIEAIGLSNIFPRAKFYVTDIDHDVIIESYLNITKAVSKEIIPLVGSLCDPLEIVSGQLDLIHGNVPNLVCDDNKNLSSGDDKGTFVKKGSIGRAPDELKSFALESQYAYLKGAYEVLRRGGSVITLMGGRVPIGLVSHLFCEAGLKLMPEFSVGFKEQTQPEQDYLGYAALEEKYGIEFDFYEFEDAMEILRRNKVSNPTFELSGEEIKDLLKETRVTATEALSLFKKGVRCGHTVHMFRGKKL